MSENTGPQGGCWGWQGGPPPEGFLSTRPFCRRALEVPFLKEVPKNVHEN